VVEERDKDVLVILGAEDPLKAKSVLGSAKIGVACCRQVIVAVGAGYRIGAPSTGHRNWADAPRR